MKNNSNKNKIMGNKMGNILSSGSTKFIAKYTKIIIAFNKYLFVKLIFLKANCIIIEFAKRKSIVKASVRYLQILLTLLFE